MSFIIGMIILGLLVAGAYLQANRGDELRDPMLVIALFFVILGVSYGMALVGEPNSIWMWRDIVGIAV